MRDFPIFYQHDSMQCGIACLQMVCQHYGKTYSLDTLSQFCHATTEGVSMLGISEAARFLGLETLSGKVSIERLIDSPLPCILHWEQKHFVVLYRVKKIAKFFVADPGMGLVAYDKEEFCRHWISTTENGKNKGIAMFLEPTDEFYKKN